MSASSSPSSSAVERPQSIQYSSLIANESIEHSSMSESDVEMHYELYPPTFITSASSLNQPPRVATPILDSSSTAASTAASAATIATTVPVNTSTAIPSTSESFKQQQDRSLDDQEQTLGQRVASWLVKYSAKFKGIPGKKLPPRTKLSDATVNGLLSFTGILLIGIIDYFYLNAVFDHVRYSHDYGASTTSASDADTAVSMLIGSFGATAVLVYDLYGSPYSQPRNVVGGHVASALVGVSVRLLLEYFHVPIYLQAPTAVALSVFVMDMIECVHPPGGASALIAVIGNQAVINMGYGYVLTCFGGAIICLAVACLGNNLIPTRQYPAYWLGV